MTRKIRRCVGMVLVVASLLGANTSAALADLGVTASPEALPPIVVMRDDGSAPAGCSPAEAANLILSFFDAFNRGNQAQLTTFFGADFMWFGVSSGEVGDGVGDFFGYDPASGYASAGPWAETGLANEVLPPYFAERHTYHDQWRLVELGVYPHADGAVADLLFHVARRADDLPSAADGQESILVGKGQINCTAQTIVLWVMNPMQPGSMDEQLPCPPPPEGTVPDAVVVCGPP